jgi:hypothetical protein
MRALRADVRGPFSGGQSQDFRPIFITTIAEKACEFMLTMKSAAMT